MAKMLRSTFGRAELAQLARLISPTPLTGEMSADEFEELRMSVESRRRGRRGRPVPESSFIAARLVLVMGASISEAASETGVSKQAMSQLIQRMRQSMS